MARPKRRGGQGIAMGGGAGRPAERDGRLAPGCRAGESPALSLPRRTPMDDRSTSRTDWRESAAMAIPYHEARGDLSCPFRIYFRFCKSTSGFTPTSEHTLFPYCMGVDILDCPGHFSKYFRFPNSTSGPTPETGNGLPTSLFH